ncbi:MAG: hypothetical protein ACSHW7_03975 [Patiriisocius sp.]|uniref:hypothetical protein n=1 Tax=Patiriisocius sp. TaxID=2822396 RepID=UPI003EFABBF1
MNQPLAYFKSSIIVLLAAFYLLTPLSGAILEGLHKISHAVSQSTTHHHHHGHNAHSHGHDHETISFIAEIFSEKQQSDSNEKIATVKIDKHFSEISYTLKTPQRTFIFPNFNYSFAEVTCLQLLESPPPEV